MRFQPLRMCAVLTGAAMLTGCVAVPPVVSALSYAADGVSMIFSGKSISDHALSAVAFPMSLAAGANGPAEVAFLPAGMPLGRASFRAARSSV